MKIDGEEVKTRVVKVSDNGLVHVTRVPDTTKE